MSRVALQSYLVMLLRFVLKITGETTRTWALSTLGLKVTDAVATLVRSLRVKATTTVIGTPAAYH